MTKTATALTRSVCPLPESTRLTDSSVPLPWTAEISLLGTISMLGARSMRSSR
jgi:hypothetical protein